MNTYKAIVDESGKMARRVNPYLNQFTGGAYNFGVAKEYWDFHKSNPPRPITIPQTPGKEVVVMELFEIWEPSSGGFFTSNCKQGFKAYQDFIKYYHDVKTRIAFEVIEAVDEPHPLDGGEISNDSDTPHEKYLDAVIANREKSGLYEDDCVTLKNKPQSEWNNAIDEAVKLLEAEQVANYLKYESLCANDTLIRMITQLKSLKK